jgi:DNA helicase HerA-like ATPase
MTSIELLNIELNKPFFMIIAGKSGSAKSHFLKFLMREINTHNSFDYGIVRSNTAWENSFDYIPKKYIYEEFNENIIKNLIKIQKDNLSKGINKRAFIILDDCISEKEMEQPIMKKLAIQGRHYNLTTIVTTQYIHLIPPVLRANSHYNCFFNIGKGVRELKATYDAFGQRFKSYDKYKKFYYKAIKDHKFIMYNNQEGKYNIYRAPGNIPKFFIKYNKRIIKK